MFGMNIPPVLKPVILTTICLVPPEIIPADSAPLLDESGYPVMDESGRIIYEE